MINIKKCFISIFFCMLIQIAKSQSDSGLIKLKEIMARAGQMPDTSQVPDDNLTKEIRQLRSERKALNVSDIIKIKIAEDEKKNEDKLPKEYYERLSAAFANGYAARWLENFTIRLYRNYFTEKEIKQLIIFFKTSAGKKWAANFPLIIIESAGSAEIIGKLVAKNISDQMKMEGKIK